MRLGKCLLQKMAPEGCKQERTWLRNEAAAEKRMAAVLVQAGCRTKEAASHENQQMAAGGNGSKRSAKTATETK
jgi:hypothetical protein